MFICHILVEVLQLINYCGGSRLRCFCRECNGFSCVSTSLFYFFSSYYNIIKRFSTVFGTYSFGNISKFVYIAFGIRS